MFYFGLCEKLGFACPRELLKRLTSSELTYWAAYFKVQKDTVNSEMVKQEMRAKVRRNF